jgi:hypothetical protein
MSPFAGAEGLSIFTGSGGMSAFAGSGGMEAFAGAGGGIGVSSPFLSYPPLDLGGPSLHVIPSSSLAPESASNRPIDILGMMLD